MKLAQRSHFLVIGGAQADFGECLAALREGRLQFPHIVALPSRLARGVGQQLQLARSRAPLILEQPPHVGVQADDISRQRDFGARGFGLERAGDGDNLETAALFLQGALMVARRLAGIIEQGAERTDQQDDKDQRQEASHSGPPPRRLIFHIIAVRHYRHISRTVRPAEYNG